MRVSLHSHLELLHSFLGRRTAIVDNIERLLNGQKEPLAWQQNLALLSERFKDCFFTASGLASAQASMRNQLEQAHWASGFKPRAEPGNDLVDPAEQMLRAFHYWRQTRWPGNKGRVHFAHTLFNLYVLRCLALLCMRLWDEDESNASARLAQLQDLLDQLWSGAPADQPRLVRKVCWLLPVAMSPTTDSLAGYFEIAAQIATTFAEADRLETHKAWVQTGAGHLRSQLYQLARQRAVSIDDETLVLLTRRSNALDVALLVQGLVTLLEAYERCLQRADAHQRLELASAICQGFSPDPELFINRPDLLGPYSMIEHLFITTGSDGQAVYTAMGQRHLALLQQYAALLARLAQPLHEDCLQLHATGSTYSPCGALYGFASNLLELMAFKTLQHGATSRFSLEDVFTAGDADKLAWVNGWRKLPHIKPDVLKQFEYPGQFVAAIGARVADALHHRVSTAGTAARGSLFILPEAGPPALPRPCLLSSDPHLVAAGQAEAMDGNDLLHCRLEGEFLVSYQTAGGWAAITKDVLTGVLGKGHDAKASGLPPSAGRILALMCPEIKPVSESHLPEM